MTDIWKPVQPSIETAFEAAPPSSSVQPDAGKQRLLAVSLLYTESTGDEPGEPLLTVRQVAELLGFSAATVYALCSDGTLRRTRIGSSVRIARSDLHEFVKARTEPPAPGRMHSPLLLPTHHHKDEDAVAAPDGGGHSEVRRPGGSGGTE